MTPAALPADEVQRLHCLDRLALAEGEADPVLDGLTRCAAHLCEAPIAHVSLIDRDRQWFKAKVGFALHSTARNVAFCAHALLGEGVFEVPDSRADERFADNPLVTDAPHVRAYAGVPLTVDGHRVGVLGVIHVEPYRLSPAQRALLVDLARSVEQWLLSRREQRALEDARRHELQRSQALRRFAAEAPGVIFQLLRRPDGRTSLPFASDRMREVYELEPDAVRDDTQPVFDRVHPDDLPALRASIARSIRELSVWRHEYRVRLPRGGERWVEGHASPERLADSSIQWHGYMSDVTERRALAAQVVESQQRRLAAEQASREKGLFLSRASHELRTPLNAVLGFTQLMQLDEEFPLPPRQRQRLEHVQRASDYLLQLVNELLAIGRSDQPEPLAIGPVPLAALLDESLALVEPLAQRQGVRIEAPSLPAGLTVQANRLALEQVLTNLLSNAIKYNRPQGAVFVSATPTDTGRVWIAVQDQGAGIDAARMAELFQPFNRLGAEHTGVEGNGLGLLIARQLVQAMGGELAVESPPGEGCRFHFTLPLATTAGDRGPTTLLYIEDEPVNALLIQDAIGRAADWRLQVAVDGTAGLADARRLKPAVVLTDMNLPGLSGLDVMRALRADPQTRDIPCIALSADAMPDQIRSALEAGFDDYLTKPVDLTLLMQRLRHWLLRRAPAAA